MKIVIIILIIVACLAICYFFYAAKRNGEDLKKILDLRIEDNDIFDKYK